MISTLLLLLTSNNKHVAKAIPLSHLLDRRCGATKIVSYLFPYFYITCKVFGSGWSKRVTLMNLEIVVQQQQIDNTIPVKANVVSFVECIKRGN